MDNKDTFPYRKSFLCGPEWFFKNLVGNKYVEVSREPYIDYMRKQSRDGKRRAGSTRRGLADAPWGYKGEEVSLVVDPKAFAEADQITDLFTEEARVRARIRGKASPHDAWNDPVAGAKIRERAAARLKRGGDTGGGFETAAQREAFAHREACYELAPECTSFKVSLARAVYEFLLPAPAKAVVLDPFAGWGDRCLGAAAAGVKSYTGVDPNTTLRPGYERLWEFLRKAAPGTAVELHHIPFEEFMPPTTTDDVDDIDRVDDPYDLVFSSPPFFDYEIYCEEGDKENLARQSTRHKSRAAWLREWFLPVTDRAWGMLRPGGRLAYYMTDERGEVTGPLCEHMKKAGREFEGIIACRRGKKRPMPLWVWKKG